MAGDGSPIGYPLCFVGLQCPQFAGLPFHLASATGGGSSSPLQCPMCREGEIEIREYPMIRYQVVSAPKVISQGSENGPVMVPRQKLLKKVPDNRCLIVALLGITFPWCSPRDSNEFRVIVVGSLPSVMVSVRSIALRRAIVGSQVREM